LEHFLTVSDVKEKPSGPQQNPLFKWVKESTGSSQISEQKHFELPWQMKSTAQSSKLTPSSPAVAMAGRTRSFFTKVIVQ
jgi:hypothetical protein